MKFNSVNNDFTLLKEFQSINAPDKRALPAPGRTDKNNDFTFVDV
jgi:hypothetical protein